MVPEYPPHVVGGGGIVYQRIAEHMRRRGHEVVVAYGDFTGSGPERIPAGPTLPEIRALSSMRTPRNMPWIRSAMPPTLGGVRRLRQTIGEGWDVAHLHGVGFPLVDLAARFLRQKNIPFVFTIHGVPNSPRRRGFWTSAIFQSYMRFGTSATIRHAAEVTAVSASLLSDRQLGKTHGMVIYNGTDVMPPAPDFHAVHPLANSPIRVLSISRISLNKGLDLAVEAVARLNREGYSVTYDLFGPDGGEKESIRGLIARCGQENMINLRGTFEPSRRVAIMREYHALLVPSRVEGFGLAALEGLAAGIPVIASRVDGLAEFLSDENAILVNKESVRDLERAILKLYDVNLTAALAQGARKTVESFSWEHSLSEYAALLESVASRERSLE